MKKRFSDEQIISVLLEAEAVALAKEISLEALRDAPGRILRALKTHFTQQDFDFLMSFKRGEPLWNLAPEPHIYNLPALQWKLRNIGLM